MRYRCSPDTKPSLGRAPEDGGKISQIGSSLSFFYPPKRTYARRLGSQRLSEPEGRRPTVSSHLISSPDKSYRPDLSTERLLTLDSRGSIINAPSLALVKGMSSDPFSVHFEHWGRTLPPSVMSSILRRPSSNIPHLNAWFRVAILACLVSSMSYLAAEIGNDSRNTPGGRLATLAGQHSCCMRAASLIPQTLANIDSSSSCSICDL
jgi:hypothetical protein